MDEPSPGAACRDGDSQRGETNAQWASFAASRDHDLRNALVEKYMPLVRLLAERLHSDLPQSVEVEDLASSGTFGLMSSIDSFDPTMGVKFETFATPRVRGAMLDELRSLDWAPRVLRSRAHRISSSTHELRAELGRPPTDDEVAEHSGVDARKIDTIRRQVFRPTPVSLLADCSWGDDKKSVRRIDFLRDDRAPDPFWSLHCKEIRRTMVDTIGSLPRQERLVVILYYFEQLTMKQIGKVLDLSESRVCQIHSDIILRLQRRLLRWKEELLAPQH